MGFFSRLWGKIKKAAGRVADFGKKVANRVSGGIGWIKDKVVDPTANFLGKIPGVKEAWAVAKEKVPWIKTVADTWNTVTNYNDAYKKGGLGGLATKTYGDVAPSMIPKLDNVFQNNIKERLPFGVGRMIDKKLKSIPAVQRYRHPTGADFIKGQTSAPPKSRIPSLDTPTATTAPFIPEEEVV